MKNHVKTFESFEMDSQLNELSPAAYRSHRDRTSDWPWQRFAAGGDRARADRAERRGRGNDLSKELFEREFYQRFSPGEITIEVGDSRNPARLVELSFARLSWRANWTHYDLEFRTESGRRVTVHGDTAARGQGQAYILDSDAQGTLDFRGSAVIDSASLDLLSEMFRFGKGSWSAPD